MHGYLRHLANFARIVEAGSLTLASERLGTGASTLSDSVRILEERTGTKLLIRGRSGVAPTVTGEALYEQARIIVQALEASFPNERSDHPKGLVRLSIPTELASAWFANAYASVLRDAPEVSLVIHVEDILLDAKRFERDIYVRVSGQSKQADLLALHCLETRSIMVASPSLLSFEDQGNVEQLTSLPIIVGTGGKIGDPATFRLPDGEELKFERVLRVSAIADRIALAKQGVGSTTCIKKTVANEIDGGEMIAALPERFSIPLYATIGTPHSKPSPAVRYVADRLAEAWA
ncbi:MAG: LysR family transcriptional regulator [Pseudomonadota bacterium]